MHGMAVEGRAESSKIQRSGCVSWRGLDAAGCRPRVFWVVRRGVRNGDEGKLESVKIAFDNPSHGILLTALFAFASLTCDCAELRRSGNVASPGLRLSLDHGGAWGGTYELVNTISVQGRAKSTRAVQFADGDFDTPRRSIMIIIICCSYPLSRTAPQPSSVVFNASNRQIIQVQYTVEYHQYFLPLRKWVPHRMHRPRNHAHFL